MFQILISFIEFFSKSLTASIVLSLIHRPKEAKLYRNEESIMSKSKRSSLTVNSKKVKCYSWGSGKKNIMIVHGWSSRASRFYKLIEKLVDANYRVIAFDMPGHGESEGNGATILDVNFILKELQNKFGPFEAIVCHSLGALFSFYALKNGLFAKKIISISSVCEFKYATYRAASFVNLKDRTINALYSKLEKIFRSKTIWTDFSADNKIDDVGSKIIIIHDRFDDYVDYSQSKKINDAAKDSKMISTEGLGHFKILSEDSVVKNVLREINDSDIKDRLSLMFSGN